MNAPFVFGKLAIDLEFTNRNEEMQRLINNFNSLTSTVLISPRRWGKSSLVLQAANEVTAANKKLKVCMLDAFSLRTEEEFYQVLAVEVLKASASKMDVLLENAKKFMGRFIPMVSFNADNQNEIALSLNWKEVRKNPADILDMAEKIAEEKGWRFIICIDEFQNISSFENPLAFQKKLRSVWQNHQHVAYCLYGSKRHMMIDVFTNTSMPFYKFGDVFFLEKIKREHWIPFIVSRFRDTKKNISDENAALIADLAECHPYYVQQLAQQSWLRTPKACSADTVHMAHRGIVDQLSLLFQSKTDELSNTQVNFLKALISGEEQLSAKDTLEKYNLGTSANVIKIKRALENKEIIDLFTGEILILDPMYHYWLKTDYFKIKTVTND